MSVYLYMLNNLEILHRMMGKHIVHQAFQETQDLLK